MIGGDLLKTVDSYMKPEEALKVKEALFFASRCHAGQKRKTGEIFVYHPVSVALPLAKLKFDYETICAALLHDVSEDACVSEKEIEKKFGKTIAGLVNGLTKLSKIHFKDHMEEYSVENLRKMFLAMAQDVRVVIIKLSDRLHNLQTLEGHKSFKQRQIIAKESLDIYAPLASRLGMGWLKGSIEDLAFPHLKPKEYKWTRNILEETIPAKEVFLVKFQKEGKKKILENNIEIVEIHGRVKRLFSLYKKLQRYDKNINRIYDLVAIRIIVPSVSDCYKALGIVHENFRPLIGRIKDYIAVPKTNGYQSLHTTVLTSDAEIAEVQIRTAKMHEEAEYGIAAYWHYDEVGKPKHGEKAPAEKLNWIKQLAEWQKDLKDNSEFKKSLRIDFFKDRLFVFTPLGEVLDLPEGATPVDFAYNIHTDVGHKCIGAKINDKLVPLDYKLENGDMIEIVTSKVQRPSHDWLEFVKTNQAKTKIKNWFKKGNRIKNIEDGKEILNHRLRYLKNISIDRVKRVKKDDAFKKFHLDNFDSVLAMIGQGEINADRIIREIFPDKEILIKKPKKFFFFGKSDSPRAIIEGQRGILTNIAKCCNPIMGDRIKAYITRSKGASVHKADCPELSKTNAGERVLSAEWDRDSESLSTVTIEVRSLDRVGLLKDITSLLSEKNINITNLIYKTKTKSDLVIFTLTIEIMNLSNLLRIIESIEKIDGVTKTIRK